MATRRSTPKTPSSKSDATETAPTKTSAKKTSAKKTGAKKTGATKAGAAKTGAKKATSSGGGASGATPARASATRAAPARRAAGKAKTPEQLGSRLVTPALLRGWALPSLEGTTGKEERGHVLVVGGSEQIPGAAILSALAALRAGAGKLQIATSRGVAPLVAVTVPEACVFGLPHDRQGELAAQGWRRIADQAERCQSLLVGPGMTSAAAARGLIEHCVREQIKATLVLDAEALSVFAGGEPLARRHRAGMVLTPHAGEMASLWKIPRDRVLADPVGLARQTAARLGAVVVLKGPCTIIAAPDGTTFHNTAGNLGLGTSGSGDTLSGLIAGLCARGADALQGAVWGVHLHARAGEVLARQMGPLGFLARELLAEIPPLLARMSSG